MRQRALICVVILFCLKLTAVNAQMPNLDPSQTVNPATGEMGFNLPLGAVAGRNGTSFPISIGYQAGILYGQEASAAGLGFGYGAGSISRKVIHVPDDNDGGRTNSYEMQNRLPDCRTAWWVWAYRIFIFVIGIVVSVVCAATGQHWGVGLIVSAFVAMMDYTVTSVLFAPNNYVAGGAHLKGYDPNGDINLPELHGRGYFKEAGQNRDMPDLYFVSTPFISGELVWCGDYNPSRSSPGSNGYFVFKNTKGGSKKEKRTIKVDYNVDEEKFLITLEDGTRLFFEETQNGGTFYSKVFWQHDPSGGTSCDLENMTRQIQRVPEQWLLTKVLYPDYIDNGNDLNPLTDPELAKGSWIVFGYKRTAQINARPLPSSVQGGIDVTVVTTAGSDPIAENASVYEEVQLEWVRTPNQSAQYFYSAARLDNLWFKTNMMNWPAYTRSALNPAPAHKVTRRSDAVDPIYVKGLRLDSILVYSSANDTLRRVRFNTDYTLKPGSFHSYSKNTSEGGFIEVPGNPDAACLTLKSIEIADRTNSKTYNIYFNYIENSTRVWNPAQIWIPDGTDPVTCYIEQKDYWGYFSQKVSIENDFNMHGLYSRAAQAEYWSMNKIELPSGMNISWEYEPQRYDAANNQPVTSAIGKKKHGGGIRVKKMTIDGGVDKPITRSYFYTDVIGEFFETEDNSSGHATVEPFPYLAAAGADPRAEAARGGYYTPAKVAYEMVQVVDNFLPGEDVQYRAPYGFTVYEYITAKDNSSQETFINEGRYGEIDNSWKRGFLKKKSAYNKKKQQISSETYHHEFVEQNKGYDPAIFNLVDSSQSHLYEHRCGWVKAVKTETKVNGVITTSYQKYADDLNPKNTPDYLNFSRKELQIVDARNQAPKSFPITGPCRALTCRTKFLKGTDANDAYDYILVRTENQSNIKIAACANATESPAGGSWTTNYSSYSPNSFDLYLVGAALFKMNDANPAEDDLIVLASTADDLSEYLYVVVFHDIGINEANQVCWTGTPTFTKIILNNDDFLHIRSEPNRYYNYPTGSVIGNFYGDDPFKPDFIIFTSARDVSQFPGDNVTVGGSTAGKYRNILAFTDFVEAPGQSKEMKLWRNGTSELYRFYGDQGFMADKDGAGGQNDLVIVGSGVSINAGYFYQELARPLSYQIFNNINWNGDPNSADPCYIGFGQQCSNCDGQEVLFSLRPNFDNQWISTRFSGFYDDGNDKMKFVYYSENAAENHFYFLNYLPVYYEGDYDGTPNRSYTSSNDGSILLSTSIPAYWKYPEMDYVSQTNQMHMLAPTCGAATLKFPSGITDAILCGELFTSSHARKVLASSASTWAPVNGAGKAYLPVNSYTWKVPTNATGTPTVDYTVFNYAQDADNGNNWELNGSVCKYTENSQAKETAKPTSNTGRLYSAAIYGHDGILPIASVTKAQFEECGVFTCDYDDNRDGYFDKENSWEKGIGTDPDNPKPGPAVGLSRENLFGTKSVRVHNAWGPTRNCRLSKGKNYLLTARVKVESGKAWMAADYRYKTKATDTDWPVTGLTRDEAAGLHGIELGPTGGKWVLMKLEIPAATVLKAKDWDSNNWYARVYVGSVIGGTVYIQDIRIAPGDAMISSTYYDTLLQQPIVSIDANNHPGQKVTYDGFGRPVKWEKLHLAEIPGTSGFTTLLQEKSYSTSNEGIYLHTPSVGDKYVPGEQIVIKWRNERGRDVQIFYSSTNAAPWVSIGSVTHVDGQREYSYNWPIPAGLAAGSLYGIKIVDIAAPTEVYDQSGAFELITAKVLFPTEGAIFYTGMPHEIRYLVIGSDPITISVNGTPIASGLTNTGTYVWNVSSGFEPSKDVRIQISAGAATAESKKFTVKKRSFFRRNIYNLLNPR